MAASHTVTGKAQSSVCCCGTSTTGGRVSILLRPDVAPKMVERIKTLTRQRFYDGARHRHGIEGEAADRIFEKMAAFANFGFPESHSQSFASLVFYSSWFKLHHPAAFCAALLRAQRVDVLLALLVLAVCARLAIDLALPPEHLFSIAPGRS